MLALIFSLDIADIDTLKAELRRELPTFKSSHRLELGARACGYKSFTALRCVAAERRAVCELSWPAAAAFLRRLGLPEDSKPLVHAIARFLMRRVMRDHPRLSWHGLGLGRPKAFEKPTDWLPTLQKSRADLLAGEGGVTEFLRAYAFMSRVKKIQTINKNRSSYNLKHIAEKMVSCYPDGQKLGPMYVANGPLIIAALALDFKMRTFVDQLGYESLNVSFNVSQRSLDDLDGEIRPNSSVAQARAWKAARVRWA